MAGQGPAPGRLGKDSLDPGRPTGTVVGYPELQPIFDRRRPSRRPTRTELLLAGLGVGILLAACFVGYAAAYRLQASPGMVAVLPTAEHTGAAAIVVANPDAVLMLTRAARVTPTTSPSPPAPTATMRPLTPKPAAPAPAPPESFRPPATSPPSRLVIGKLGVDIPVVPVGVRTIREGNATRQVWDDAPHAGGFHATSAYPGQQGNTVINGHRDVEGSVFRSLGQLAEGDEILVYAGKVAYPYLVTEKLMVREAFASAEQRAENLRLISYMPEERLTLVTCAPVGLATHRLLVVAKPPGLIAPGMPEAGSTTLP